MSWHKDAAEQLEDIAPEDLGNIKDGAYIAGALPYIDANIERKLTVLDNKMTSELAAGNLTAEISHMFCVERICLLKLMKSFKQQVNNAVSRGDALQKALDL